MNEVTLIKDSEIAATLSTKITLLLQEVEDKPAEFGCLKESNKLLTQCAQVLWLIQRYGMPDSNKAFYFARDIARWFCGAGYKAYASTPITKEFTPLDIYKPTLSVLLGSQLGCISKYVIPGGENWPAHLLMARQKALKEFLYLRSDQGAHYNKAMRFLAQCVGVEELQTR